MTRKAQAEYVGKLREAAKIERMDKPAETAAKPDAPKPETVKPETAPAKPDAAKDSKMAPAKK